MTLRTVLTDTSAYSAAYRKDNFCSSASTTRTDEGLAKNLHLDRINGLGREIFTGMHRMYGLTIDKDTVRYITAFGLIYFGSRLLNIAAFRNAAFVAIPNCTNVIAMVQSLMN